MVIKRVFACSGSKWWTLLIRTDISCVVLLPNIKTVKDTQQKQQELPDYGKTYGHPPTLRGQACIMVLPSTPIFSLISMTSACFGWRRVPTQRSHHNLKWTMKKKVLPREQQFPMKPKVCSAVVGQAVLLKPSLGEETVQNSVHMTSCCPTH